MDSSKRKGSASVRFDLFELDAKNSWLRRNGLPVDLPPQALRVLVMLAERPDELVTRQEIKEALWPGELHGDFDNRLNFTIKKLREALRDDADQPRYIQTVRNAGYRFVAPLRESQEPPLVPTHPADQRLSGQGVGLPQVAQSAGLAQRAGLRFLTLMAVIVAAIATMAVFLVRPQRIGQVAYDARTLPAAADQQIGPRIDSVTPTLLLPLARQKIVIEGRGFGLHVPYAQTDSPYLAIRDVTRDWAAGRMIPQNQDEVMLDVESWTNTEIVVGGFSGSYGQKGWKLVPGDKLEVAVWNPQSGSGPALYQIAVISGAPQ